MRTIIGNIIKGNTLFSFFKKNDAIAVGVSGGKDSLILLLALHILIEKMNVEHKMHIKLKGFIVSLGFRKINYSSIIKWAKKNKIELEILDSNIVQILNQKKEKGLIQCSFCSRMKKAVLIKAIKKQKYNKLAFGHHLDDVIETYIINILNQGRIAAFKPITYLTNNKIWLIRPMILTRVKDIIKATKRNKIPIIKNICPNEKTTQRSYVRQMMNKMYLNRKYWPNAYVNIARSILNKENSYLLFNDIKEKNKV